MFCALLDLSIRSAFTGPWSSGYYMLGANWRVTFVRRCFRDGTSSLDLKMEVY